MISKLQPGCACCEGGVCHARICHIRWCGEEGTLRVSRGGEEWESPIEIFETVPGRKWYAKGCVTVSFDPADLPLIFDVELSITDEETEASFPVEIVECGQVASFEDEVWNDQMILHIGGGPKAGCPFPGECPEGAEVSYLVEDSDDGVSWNTVAAGSVTLDADCTVDATVARPTRPQTRVSTVMSPPPGWRGWIPGENQNFAFGHNVEECVPAEMAVVGIMDFDSENWILPRCGPVPKAMCWDGIEMTWAGVPIDPESYDCGDCAGLEEGWGLASLWACVEPIEGTTRHQTFLPETSCGAATETTATVDTIVTACLWVNETTCEHYWSVRRLVPACGPVDGGIDPDPGGGGGEEPDPGGGGGEPEGGGGEGLMDAPCDGEPGTGDFYLCRKVMLPNPFDPEGPDVESSCGLLSAIGRSAPAPCHGQVNPLPPADIEWFADYAPIPCAHEPHGRCHAPIEAYNAATVAECGGGFAPMAMARVGGPAVEAEAPAAPSAVRVVPRAASNVFRWAPGTRRDEIVRSCLYGGNCGCATRKCWAKGWKTVTMAGDCKACLQATVLAPPVARDPGWDYTLAPAD